jgi:hypothetical protein
MMCISALSAALCCWTKQNFLPLLLALVLWVTIVDGWRKGLTYLGLIAGIGAVVSGILLLCFGASNMHFQMVTIPASHPWQNIEKGTAVVLSGGFLELLANCSWTLAILIGVLLIDGLLEYSQRETRTQRFSLSRWMAQRSWTLPLLVSIALIPTSVLGYIKVGGFLNHLACTNYFLLAAAAIGLIDVVSRTANFFPMAVGIACSASTIFSGVIAFQSLLMPFNIMALNWNVVKNPYDNVQQQLYRYCQAHPEEVYCPWNNLTTLYADGKMYDFEWGILDRYYANRMPQVKEFYDYVPKKMNMIVYTAPPQTSACQNLIGFNRQASVPELNRCIVIER